MKKNMIRIITANLLYTLLVAVNNFIIPKYTSVETYAAMKEFTLYITTYCDIMTLGYINGVYLEYGGKDIKTISPAELGRSFMTFVMFMLPICSAVFIWGLISYNVVITAVGIGLLTSNLNTYYRMFYQATGDFKAYGSTLNISRVLILIINLLLIFVFRTDNRIFYVSVLPAVGVGMVFYRTWELNRKIPIVKYMRFNFSFIKKHIKDGFALMLGDFATKFFSSIDRWFVKGLLQTFAFAMYSFAVSMESMVNTFMTPITLSMYNYFCKKPSIREIRRFKDNALIYSLVIIAGAFPCKWILEVFLTKYISANAVIFPLFAAQGVSTIIRGIYVNKYKADGTPKKYLFQTVAMLVLAAILNGAFYLVWKSMIGFALATLLTNIIWLIWCESKASELRFGWRSLTSAIILLSVYLYTGFFLSSIVGCVIYCGTGLFLGLTLMRSTFIPLCQSLLQTVTSKFKKA